MVKPEGFFLKKGNIGCLLIHGFSGSPPEMKPLGEYLAERNITVLGVKLSGHGTTPEDFSKTNWGDWVKSAEQGLFELKKHCDKIFIAGLSMGGAITLHLAANHPVLGIITYAGAAFIKDFKLIFLPVISLFLKYIPLTGEPDFTDPNAINYIWSYDKIPTSCIKSLLQFQKILRGELHKITCPALVFHGMCDKALTPQNAKYIFEKISSKEKRCIYLGYSGHGLTVDSEKEDVWEMTYNFILKFSK